MLLSRVKLMPGQLWDIFEVRYSDLLLLCGMAAAFHNRVRNLMAKLCALSC